MSNNGGNGLRDVSCRYLRVSIAVFVASCVGSGSFWGGGFVAQVERILEL